MKDEKKKADLVRAAQKTASPQQSQFWHEVGERMANKEDFVKPRPPRRD
jgi:hypothetical protein